MNKHDLNIQPERLWQSLMSLGEIGETQKGGSCRLALSSEDGKARDLVSQWMRDAGLTVTVDQIGNIFGRRPGTNPDLSPVATGSHIDTQPTGGKFDGCYGVMAGLEVMRTLQDHNIQTEAPLELIIWTNEEGARFVPTMMGSGVFCDLFSLEDMLNTTDRDGIRVGDELKRIGYDGDLPVPSHELGAYIEAHIEQGPILEQNKNTIGVVSGSLGLRWFEITVKGMEAHAGPTPMKLRRDALYAATFIVQQVIQMAKDYHPIGRCTVGILDVHPSSPNVIPGEVRFTVDIRHLEAHLVDEMEARLRKMCDEVAQGNGPGYPTEISIKPLQAFPPTAFDQQLVASVEKSAQSRAYPHETIVSGAGHDAVYVARKYPTAMIFIPCKDGISHNETEYAYPEDVAAGANVLLDTMLAQAKISSR